MLNHKGSAKPEPVSRLPAVFVLVFGLLTGSLPLQTRGQTVTAPQIAQVQGQAATGSSITITGSGFGSGPHVLLYDDFEDGTPGNTKSNLTATVGSWTALQNQPFVFSPVARSGNVGALAWANGTQAGATVDFGGPQTELLVSYWVIVPPGTGFPGSGTQQFPSQSAWKMAWIIDTDYQGNSNDLCLPTYTGSGDFYLAGNSFSLTKLPDSSTWWAWGDWMRMTVWLHADPSAPKTNGSYYWQVTSKSKGQVSISANGPVMSPTSTSGSQYRYLNLPGWLISGGQPVYDDVYVAVGANSQARVEIGDAPTYAQSRVLSFLIPSAWSNTTITAKIPPSAIPNGTAYLYVTDSTGHVNATGFPLTAPSTSTASIPVPDPPTDLIVE